MPGRPRPGARTDGNIDRAIAPGLRTTAPAAEPPAAARRPPRPPGPAAPPGPARPAAIGPAPGGPTPADPALGNPADGTTRIPARRPTPADPEPLGTTRLPALPGPDALPENDEDEGTTLIPALPATAAAEPATGRAERSRRIDESLVRLTAAHEGLPLAPREADESAAEPADGPPEGPLSPPLGPRQRALRAAVVVLTVLLFVAATVGWSSKLWLQGRIHQVDALDPQASTIVDGEAQADDRNVLLLGLDSGPGGASGAGADTLVVVHVPASGPVTRLAFPRDLEINRPPCRRWDPAAATYLDQTVPAEARTTLDSAYRSGGPACAVRVVQQLSGLAISGFAAVDLDALGGMTDALGGVATCLDRPVVDGVLGPVSPAAGPTRVSGAQVGGIVTARHVTGDPPTDQGLVERQQRVFAAALDRVLSTRVLLNPWEVRRFGQSFGQGVVADGLDPDQLLAAVSAAAGTADADGPFLTVPTTGATNARGNVELRDADASALFTAVRTGGAVPAAVTSTEAASTSPAPSAVTVDVLNGSDRTGLAGQVGDALKAAGFTLGQVANAPQPTADTMIRFSPDRAAAAQVLAAAVPSARTAPDTTASGLLQLVVGNSYDGTVRAVPAAAQPPAPTAPAHC